MTGQLGGAGRPLLPGKRPVRVGDLRGGRGQGAGRQDAGERVLAGGLDDCPDIPGVEFGAAFFQPSGGVRSDED